MPQFPPPKLGDKFEHPALTTVLIKRNNQGSAYLRAWPKAAPHKFYFDHHYHLSEQQEKWVSENRCAN